MRREALAGLSLLAVAAGSSSDGDPTGDRASSSARTSSRAGGGGAAGRSGASGRGGAAGGTSSGVTSLAFTGASGVPAKIEDHAATAALGETLARKLVDRG